MTPAPTQNDTVSQLVVTPALASAADRRILVPAPPTNPEWCAYLACQRAHGDWAALDRLWATLYELLSALDATTMAVLLATGGRHGHRP